MYTVTYKKAALKALATLPGNMAGRFRSAFAELAAGEGRHLDIKRLVGRPGYRMRIGDWRAIYRVNEGELEILVIEIGGRGGIYK